MAERAGPSVSVMEFAKAESDEPCAVCIGKLLMLIFKEIESLQAKVDHLVCPSDGDDDRS